LRGPASQNSDSLRHRHFHAFRDEVLKLGGFVAGTASMNIPGEEIRFHDENIRVSGSSNDKKQSYWISLIDDQYLETFGLKLLAGRNFQANNQQNICMVNETAIKALGFKTPAEAVNGELIAWNQKIKIIGVVRDFHYESIKKLVEPCIFYNVHPNEFGYYTFRFKSNPNKKELLNLKKIWENNYPNDPFIYYFMDKFFARQYATDYLFERVLMVFSILSMIIAAMGVFGLASYSMAKRTKEIGVRKVNGARVSDLMLLMIIRYLRLFFISVVIAIPIIWIGMSKWLSYYAYSVHLGLRDMIIPILITLIIILLTLSYHVMRVVKANPVDAIKDE
jgi:putative ABC transport system permease protein